MLTPATDIEDVPTLADIRKMASNSLARVGTNGRLFLPLLQNLFEEMCETFQEVLTDAKKGTLLDHMSEQPIFFLTAQNDSIVTSKSKSGSFGPTKASRSDSKLSLFSIKSNSVGDGLNKTNSLSVDSSDDGRTVLLSHDKSKSMDCDVGGTDEMGIPTTSVVQTIQGSLFLCDFCFVFYTLFFPYIFVLFILF